MENIAKTQDPYYRYKRSSLEVQSTLRETRLTNIETIARQLARPVKSIVNHMKKQLNAGMSQKNGNVVFQGQHDLKCLDAALQDYIDHFVLCGYCGNPETSAVDGKCKACGYSTSFGSKKSSDKKSSGKSSSKPETRQDLEAMFTNTSNPLYSGMFH